MNLLALHDPNLEYIKGLSDKVFPDYDIECDAFFPSQAPYWFMNRYNKSKFNIRFTYKDYLKNSNIQSKIEALNLDKDKFWYLLIFIFEYCERKVFNAQVFLDSPKECFDKIIDILKHEKDAKITLSYTTTNGDKKRKKNIEFNNKLLGKYLSIMTNMYQLIFDGVQLDINDIDDRDYIYYINKSQNESVERNMMYHCGLFTKLFFDFFKTQDIDRKENAEISDNEKDVISYLLYFTRISRNESLLESKDLVKQYFKYSKDFQYSSY